MAYTKKEKEYQKKRYKNDKTYRDKLIKENTEKHKKNKKKYADKMRDYYNTNTEYRAKKKRSMAQYNKKHKSTQRK